MGQGNDPNGLPALIRTEQSRAVALYGSTNGSSVDPTNSNTQVLLPKWQVSSFCTLTAPNGCPSGTRRQWGSVPLAIDVRVIMAQPRATSSRQRRVVAATAADVR